MEILEQELITNQKTIEYKVKINNKIISFNLETGYYSHADSTETFFHYNDEERVTDKEKEQIEKFILSKL